MWLAINHLASFNNHIRSPIVVRFAIIKEIVFKYYLEDFLAISHQAEGVRSFEANVDVKHLQSFYADFRNKLLDLDEIKLSLPSRPTKSLFKPTEVFYSLLFTPIRVDYYCKQTTEFTKIVCLLKAVESLIQFLYAAFWKFYTNTR